MRFRRRPKFHPSVSIVVGLESLEDRRLLNGSGKGLISDSLRGGDIPEVRVAAAHVVKASASGADVDATNSKVGSGGGRSDASTVTPARNVGESSGIQTNGSDTSAESNDAASRANLTTVATAHQNSGGDLSAATDLTPADVVQNAAASDTDVPDESNGDISVAVVAAVPNGSGTLGARAGLSGFSGAPGPAPAIAGGITADASPRDAQVEGADAIGSRGGGVAEDPSVVGGRVVEQEPGESGGELPSPRISDLLTSFLPFDQSSLENAIDRCLARFETLGDEMSELRGPTSLLPALTAAAISGLAAEVVRRQKRKRDHTTDATVEQIDEEFVPIPGLANPWSFGER